MSQKLLAIPEPCYFHYKNTDLAQTFTQVSVAKSTSFNPNLGEKLDMCPNSPGLHGPQTVLV